jgi:hypothetical protein
VGEGKNDHPRRAVTDLSEWRTNHRTHRPFRQRVYRPSASAPKSAVEVPADINVINFANSRADEGWRFRHAEPISENIVEETWTKADMVLYMRYDPNSNKILSVEVA